MLSLFYKQQHWLFQRDRGPAEASLLLNVNTTPRVSCLCVHARVLVFNVAVKFEIIFVLTR